MISLFLFALVISIGSWANTQFSKREFETEARNIVAALRSGMSVVDGLVTSLDASGYSQRHLISDPALISERSQQSSESSDQQLNNHFTKVLTKYNYVVGLGRFERVTGTEIGATGVEGMWRYDQSQGKVPLGPSSAVASHYPLTLAKFRSNTDSFAESLTGLDLVSVPGIGEAIEKNAFNGKLLVMPVPDELKRTGHLWIFTASSSVIEDNRTGYLLEVDIEDMASSGGVSFEAFSLSLSQYSELGEFGSDVGAESLYKRQMTSVVKPLLSDRINDHRLINSFEVGDKTLILEVRKEAGISTIIIALLAISGAMLALMFLAMVNLHGKRRHAQKLQRIESEKLFQTRQRAAVTLAAIGDAVITTDVSDNIVYANGAAESLLGYPSDQMHGRSVDDIIVPQCDQRRHGDDNESLTLVASDASTVYVDKKEFDLKHSDGGLSGKVIVLRDVSVERELTAALQHKVNHDSLTGLSNRFNFEKQLSTMFSDLEDIDETDPGHAVCFIDLDRFKEVNDTCGHAAGDELLKRIANAFQQNVRDTDVVARLGGDEFGIILRNCDDADALMVAERIREYFQSFYFEYAEQIFPVRCSIGIVHFDPADAELESVLKAADMACFEAKKRGRNSVCEGSLDEAQKHTESEVQWLPLIRKVLDENSFTLFFQSIASMSDDSMRRHEILLRMPGENGELINADMFMKTAQRYDLALEIDTWVMSSTLERISQLPAHYANDMFSINISAQAIGSEDFIEFIQQEILNHEIDPTRLCFDIKEIDTLNSPANAAEFCKQLQVLGCTVALDDFGAAMTSFSTIKSLPINEIKIDGSLIAGLSEVHSLPLSNDGPVDIQQVNPNLVLLKSICSFASSMGLTVVAEQVDNADSLAVLKSIGIEFAQGYAIAPPRPFNQFSSGGEDSLYQNAA